MANTIAIQEEYVYNDNTNQLIQEAASDGDNIELERLLNLTNDPSALNLGDNHGLTPLVTISN